MIREGCLKDPGVDAVLGLHINQIFPEVGTGTPYIGVDPIPVAAFYLVFNYQKPLPKYRSWHAIFHGRHAL